MPITIRAFFDPSQLFHSNPEYGKLTAAIKCIEQRDDVWCLASRISASVLPDSCFGGSAPPSQNIWLEKIPFPEVPNDHQFGRHDTVDRSLLSIHRRSRPLHIPWELGTHIAPVLHELSTEPRAADMLPTLNSPIFEELEPPSPDLCRVPQRIGAAPECSGHPRRLAEACSLGLSPL